jgi:hypothetical protein
MARRFGSGVGLQSFDSVGIARLIFHKLDCQMGFLDTQHEDG